MNKFGRHRVEISENYLIKNLHRALSSFACFENALEPQLVSFEPQDAYS